MGYNTRLHIGNVSVPSRDEKGLNHFQELARLEMCSIGDEALHQLFQKYVEKSKVFPLTSSFRVFFYATDGSTRITQDNYGDSLVAVPAKEVLEACLKNIDADDYRRFKVLYDLLVSMLYNMHQDDMLSVVRYGH